MFAYISMTQIAQQASHDTIRSTLLQESHEACNSAQSKQSVASDLASAINRHLANGSGRRCSGRSRSLVLGSRRRSLRRACSNDDSTRDVTSRRRNSRAVLREDDVGRVRAPDGDGHEGLAVRHEERDRGRDERVGGGGDVGGARAAHDGGDDAASGTAGNGSAGLGDGRRDVVG